MRRKCWRSVLFVPGDRPDRIAKAGARGADAVVIDLEDAVAAAAKERSRGDVVDQLRCGLTGPTMVRVNAADGCEFERDVEALASVWDRVQAVLLPKASGPDDVARLDDLLGAAVALIPIIETAAGVFEARAIAAASPRVATLLFGPADLAAELEVEPTAEGRELAAFRSQVVLAAAAARIAAPLDGPHLVLADSDGLARAVRAARTAGFGGKAVIHPDQIPAVHAGFAPLPTEVAWAEHVLTAASDMAAVGGGVARLDDGTFVDEPIIRRARSLLRGSA